MKLKIALACIVATLVSACAEAEKYPITQCDTSSQYPVTCAERGDDDPVTGANAPNLPSPGV